MQDEKNKKYFSTRDLYLATTLITLRFYMVGVDYQVEGDRRLPVGYFKFDDTSDLQDAIKKYKQGLISIEPRAFITNLRSLKAEVNNVYKNPNSEFNPEG